jgi:hypothetical protein
VSYTGNQGRYLTSLHIFTAAQIIRRPIYVDGPEDISDGAQVNTVKGVYLPNLVVPALAADIHRAPVTLYFKPDHYTALCPVLDLPTDPLPGCLSVTTISTKTRKLRGQSWASMAQVEKYVMPARYCKSSNEFFHFMKMGRVQVVFDGEAAGLVLPASQQEPMTDVIWLPDPLPLAPGYSRVWYEYVEAVTRVQSAKESAQAPAVEEMAQCIFEVAFTEIWRDGGIDAGSTAVTAALTRGLRQAQDVFGVQQVQEHYGELATSVEQKFAAFGLPHIY